MSELDTLLSRVDADDTEERHRRNIKALAKDAFKDHVLEEEKENVFRCAKPGTMVYSFRVALLPAGMIVVYGDIGDMMVQRGGMDWLERSVTHDVVSDYVLGKAVPFRDYHRRDFLTGEAVAEIRRLHDGVPYVDKQGYNYVEQAREEGDAPRCDDWEVEPRPELAISIAEDWLTYDESGMDSDSWCRAWYEHTTDWEIPQCRDYSSNDLWCYFGLSWFVRARQLETSKT